MQVSGSVVLELNRLGWYCEPTIIRNDFFRDLSEMNLFADNFRD